MKKDIGELAVLELENYILSKNEYAGTVKELNELKDLDSIVKEARGELYHWNTLLGKATNLKVLVDLSFNYSTEKLAYDITGLRIFIRPKPKWHQFLLRMKQTSIQPDAIDFKNTMKNQKEFVFSLCQSYKKKNTLFKKLIFKDKQEWLPNGILIKEGYETTSPENKDLKLLLSCDGYHLDNEQGLKKFSRNELVTFINKLLDDYMNKFNKLKKSDFNFKE